MDTSSALPLRGACDCGRNQYRIIMPSELPPSELPVVLFDVGSDYGKHKYPFLNTGRKSSLNRPGRHPFSISERLTTLNSPVHASSSPISVFLRIPLPWLHSTTYAFYPSETHAHIRRSYTPHHSPHSKRYFCGHCATTLSFWSEARPEEAEWICVNWHSLETASQELLDELGVMPNLENEAETNESLEGATQAEGAGAGGHGAAVKVSPALVDPSRFERGVVVDDHGKRVRGQPWFEEMLEGSELGRIRRRRGGNTSADGKEMVEWEIVEYEEDDGSGEVGRVFSTKRKFEQAADVAMSGAS